MSRENAGVRIIHQEASAYYAEKIIAHGRCPQGVDWNGSQSQRLRFEQLAKILPNSSGWLLADIGCGYGAMLEYLLEVYSESQFRYIGTDVSEDMLEAAMANSHAYPNATFHLGDIPPHTVDYAVVSGVFNVKQDRSNDEWLSYIKSTLRSINDVSKLGFAFNALTVYSDRDKMKNNLFYADPLFLFDFCKRNFSRNVSVLHDYGLYEFTILVRKVL